MTDANDPQAITQAFKVRADELKQRLQSVLDQRKATERELASAKDALERVQTRLNAICAEEGHLRGKADDLERALAEARKLLP